MSHLATHALRNESGLPARCGACVQDYFARLRVHKRYHSACGLVLDLAVPVRQVPILNYALQSP